MTISRRLNQLRAQLDGTPLGRVVVEACEARQILSQVTRERDLASVKAVKALTAAGYSGADQARLLGLSQQRISQIQRGGRR